MRALIIGLMAVTFAVAGCSEKTQDAAGATTASAANDTAANLNGMGDSMENGAVALGNGIDQTGEAVANGAAAVEGDLQGTTTADAKRD